MSAYLDTREYFLRCNHHEHALLFLHQLRCRDKVREAGEDTLGCGLQVVFRDHGSARDFHVGERIFLMENTNANPRVALHVSGLGAGFGD